MHAGDNPWLEINKNDHIWVEFFVYQGTHKAAKIYKLNSNLCPVSEILEVFWDGEHYKLTQAYNSHILMPQERLQVLWKMYWFGWVDDLNGSSFNEYSDEEFKELAADLLYRKPAAPNELNQAMGGSNYLSKRISRALKELKQEQRAVLLEQGRYTCLDKGAQVNPTKYLNRYGELQCGNIVLPGETFRAAVEQGRRPYALFRTNGGQVQAAGAIFPITQRDWQGNIINCSLRGIKSGHFKGRTYFENVTLPEGEVCSKYIADYSINFRRIGIEAPGSVITATLFFDDDLLKEVHFWKGYCCGMYSISAPGEPFAVRPTSESMPIKIYKGFGASKNIILGDPEIEEWDNIAQMTGNELRAYLLAQLSNSPRTHDELVSLLGERKYPELDLMAALRYWQDNDSEKRAVRFPNGKFASAVRHTLLKHRRIYMGSEIYSLHGRWLGQLTNNHVWAAYVNGADHKEKPIAESCNGDFSQSGVIYIYPGFEDMICGDSISTQDPAVEVPLQHCLAEAERFLAARRFCEARDLYELAGMTAQNGQMEQVQNKLLQAQRLDLLSRAQHDYESGNWPRAADRIRQLIAAEEKAKSGFVPDNTLVSLRKKLADAQAMSDYEKARSAYLNKDYHEAYRLLEESGLTESKLSARGLILTRAMIKKRLPVPPPELKSGQRVPPKKPRPQPDLEEFRGRKEVTNLNVVHAMAFFYFFAEELVFELENKRIKSSGKNKNEQGLIREFIDENGGIDEVFERFENAIDDLHIGQCILRGKPECQAEIEELAEKLFAFAEKILPQGSYNEVKAIWEEEYDDPVILDIIRHWRNPKKLTREEEQAQTEERSKKQTSNRRRTEKQEEEHVPPAELRINIPQTTPGDLSDWIDGALNNEGYDPIEAVNELLDPANSLGRRHRKRKTLPPVHKDPAGEGAQAIKASGRRNSRAIARFLAERAATNGELDKLAGAAAANSQQADNRGMIPALSFLLNWLGIPLKYQPGIESALCVAAKIAIPLIIGSQDLAAGIISIVFLGLHYIIRSRAPPQPFGVLAVTLMHFGLLRLLPSPSLQAEFILSAIAILILSIALHYFINSLISLISEKIETSPFSPFSLEYVPAAYPGLWRGAPENIWILARIPFTDFSRGRLSEAGSAERIQDAVCKYIHQKMLLNNFFDRFSITLKDLFRNLIGIRRLATASSLPSLPQWSVRELTADILRRNPGIGGPGLLRYLEERHEKIFTEEIRQELMLAVAGVLTRPDIGGRGGRAGLRCAGLWLAVAIAIILAGFVFYHFGLPHLSGVGEMAGAQSMALAGVIGAGLTGAEQLKQDLAEKISAIDDMDVDGGTKLTILEELAGRIQKELNELKKLAGPDSVQEMKTQLKRTLGRKKEEIIRLANKQGQEDKQKGGLGLLESLVIEPLTTAKLEEEALRRKDKTSPQIIEEIIQGQVELFWARSFLVRLLRAGAVSVGRLNTAIKVVIESAGGATHSRIETPAIEPLIVSDPGPITRKNIGKRKRTTQTALRSISELVVKPINYNWETAQGKGELPDLRGQLKITDAHGENTFCPVGYYQFRWRVLDFSEKGWEPDIIEQGVKDKHFQFTVKLVKEGREPIHRVFQIGPARRVLKCYYGKNKGTTCQVFDIVYIKTLKPGESNFGLAHESHCSSLPQGRRQQKPRSIYDLAPPSIYEEEQGEIVVPEDLPGAIKAIGGTWRVWNMKNTAFWDLRLTVPWQRSEDRAATRASLLTGSIDEGDSAGGRRLIVQSLKGKNDLYKLYLILSIFVYLKTASDKSFDWVTFILSKSEMLAMGRLANRGFIPEPTGASRTKLVFLTEDILACKWLNKFSGYFEFKFTDHPITFRAMFAQENIAIRQCELFAVGQFHRLGIMLKCLEDHLAKSGKNHGPPLSFAERINGRPVFHIGLLKTISILRRKGYSYRDIIFLYYQVIRHELCPGESEAIAFHWRSFRRQVRGVLDADRPVFMDRRETVKLVVAAWLAPAWLWGPRKTDDDQEHLVRLFKGLGHSGRAARDFSRMALDWQDDSGGPLLVTLRDELLQKRRTFNTVEELEQAESDAAGKLAAKIYAEIKPDEAINRLSEVVARGKADCFWQHLIFFVLARFINLNVAPTLVYEFESPGSKPREKEHLACFAVLTSKKVMLIDLGRTPNFKSSSPFSREEYYRRSGVCLVLKDDKINPLNLYLTVQLLNEQALRVTPLYNKGVRHLEKGEISSAESCFQKAIKICPQFVPALINLGIIYFNKGRLPDAERYFNQARAFYPGIVVPLAGKSYLPRGVIASGSLSAHGISTDSRPFHIHYFGEDSADPFYLYPSEIKAAVRSHHIEKCPNGEFEFIGIWWPEDLPETEVVLTDEEARCELQNWLTVKEERLRQRLEKLPADVRGDLRQVIHNFRGQREPIVIPGRLSIGRTRGVITSCSYSEKSKQRRMRVRPNIRADAHPCTTRICFSAAGMFGRGGRWLWSFIWRTAGLIIMLVNLPVWLLYQLGDWLGFRGERAPPNLLDIPVAAVENNSLRIKPGLIILGLIFATSLIYPVFSIILLKLSLGTIILSIILLLLSLGTIILTLHHEYTHKQNPRIAGETDSSYELRVCAIQAGRGIKVTPLGGVDGPAKCAYLVEINGCRILLDAGFDPADGGWIDFAEIKHPVDYVIISHAHLDHTGSLINLVKNFPDAKIFATAPTLEIMKVLTMDLLKLRSESNDYACIHRQVNNLLAHCAKLDFNRWYQLSEEAKIILRPAGHILGAATVSILTPFGKVGYTGDISVRPQTTVGGMADSGGEDCLFMEALYGDSVNVLGREETTAEFAAAIKKVIERGGSALIPAFALGRSAEVALIIRKLQKDGVLPPVKIYIDGMARELARIYDKYKALMPESCRSLVEADGSLFFSRRSTIKSVKSAWRDEIANLDEPHIIICGSGMLEGGCAMTYFECMAGDERNGIFCVGYASEDSLAIEISRAQKGSAITFCPDRRYPDKLTTITLNAEVRRFAFGSHSPQADLVQSVVRANPEVIALVHGSDTARQALRKAIKRVAPRIKVILPAVGKVIAVRGNRSVEFSGIEAFPTTVAEKMASAVITKLKKQPLTRQQCFERYLRGVLKEVFHIAPDDANVQMLRSFANEVAGCQDSSPAFAEYLYDRLGRSFSQPQSAKDTLWQKILEWAGVHIVGQGEATEGRAPAGAVCDVPHISEETAPSCSVKAMTDKGLCAPLPAREEVADPENIRSWFYFNPKELRWLADAFRQADDRGVIERMFPEAVQEWHSGLKDTNREHLAGYLLRMSLLSIFDCSTPETRRRIAEIFKARAVIGPVGLIVAILDPRKVSLNGAQSAIYLEGGIPLIVINGDYALALGEILTVASWDIHPETHLEELKEYGFSKGKAGFQEVEQIIGHLFAEHWVIHEAAHGNGMETSQQILEEYHVAARSEKPFYENTPLKRQEMINNLFRYLEGTGKRDIKQRISNANRIRAIRKAIETGDDLVMAYFIRQAYPAGNNLRQGALAMRDTSKRPKKAFIPYEIIEILERDPDKRLWNLALKLNRQFSEAPGREEAEWVFNFSVDLRRQMEQGPLAISELVAAIEKKCVGLPCGEVPMLLGGIINPMVSLRKTYGTVSEVALIRAGVRPALKIGRKAKEKAKAKQAPARAKQSRASGIGRLRHAIEEIARMDGCYAVDQIPMQRLRDVCGELVSELPQIWQELQQDGRLWGKFSPELKPIIVKIVTSYLQQPVRPGRRTDQLHVGIRAAAGKTKAPVLEADSVVSIVPFARGRQASYQVKADDLLGWCRPVIERCLTLSASYFGPGYLINVEKIKIWDRLATDGKEEPVAQFSAGTMHISQKALLAVLNSRLGLGRLAQAFMLELIFHDGIASGFAVLSGEENCGVREAVATALSYMHYLDPAEIRDTQAQAQYRTDILALLKPSDRAGFSRFGFRVSNRLYHLYNQTWVMPPSLPDIFNHVLDSIYDNPRYKREQQALDSLGGRRQILERCGQAYKRTRLVMDYNDVLFEAQRLWRKDWDDLLQEPSVRNRNELKHRLEDRMYLAADRAHHQFSGGTAKRIEAVEVLSGALRELSYSRVEFLTEQIRENIDAPTIETLLSLNFTASNDGVRISTSDGSKVDPYARHSLKILEKIRDWQDIPYRLFYSLLDFLLRRALDNDLPARDASHISLPSDKKPGRNDPCPCGSGKKYKKCCGRNDDEGQAGQIQVGVSQARERQTSVTQVVARPAQLRPEEEKDIPMTLAQWWETIDSERTPGRHFAGMDLDGLGKVLGNIISTKPHRAVFAMAAAIEARFYRFEEARLLVERGLKFEPASTMLEFLLSEIKHIQEVLHSLEEAKSDKSGFLRKMVVPDGKGGYRVDTLGFGGQWQVWDLCKEPIVGNTPAVLRTLKSLNWCIEHIDQVSVLNQSGAREEMDIADFSFGDVYVIEEDRREVFPNLTLMEGICFSATPTRDGRYAVDVLVSPSFLLLGRERQMGMIKDNFYGRKPYFAIRDALSIAEQEKNRQGNPAVIKRESPKVLCISMSEATMYGAEVLEDALLRNGIAAAKREMRCTDMLDAYMEEFSHLPEFSQAAPNVFAISIVDDRIEWAISLIRRIRQRFPGAKVIIGGPSTQYPEQLAALLIDFDFLVRGEGDEVLVELVRIIGGYPGTLPIEQRNLIMGLEGGIIYRSQFMLVNRISHTNMAKVIHLPKPQRRDKFYYLHTGRGCKWNCSFCGKWCGNRVRFVDNRELVEWFLHRLLLEPGAEGDLRRLEERLAEAAKAGSKLEFPQLSGKISVGLFDDDFIGNAERVEAFCDEAIRLGLSSYFELGVVGTNVADFFEGETMRTGLIDKLHNAGFAIVQLGTDGLSNAVIRQNRKGYTLDHHVIPLNDYLTRKGIVAWHNVIFFTPQTTYLEAAEVMMLYLLLPLVYPAVVNDTISACPGSHFHNLDIMLYRQIEEA
ncbi:MAG: SEC-C metal-binding domain-containing protein, partial [Candidatus Omnitrophota bacterium]|nr:SEC-C metal-binding domain-containing protein [Candidatus Omnitrophota bacterium]